jgi:hypothetical protein
MSGAKLLSFAMAEPQGFCPTRKKNAPLAQLVEQLTLNQRVEGSSPSWRIFLFEMPR